MAEEPPPYTERLKNLAETCKEVFKQHRLGQGILIPREEVIQRLECCDVCLHLMPNKKGCAKCGCLLSVKVRFKAAKCPIGEWKKKKEKQK